MFCRREYGKNMKRKIMNFRMNARCVCMVVLFIFSTKPFSRRKCFIKNQNEVTYN